MAEAVDVEKMLDEQLEVRSIETLRAFGGAAHGRCRRC